MTTREAAEASAIDGSPALVEDVHFVKAGGIVAMVAPFVFIGALLSGTDLANNTFDLLGHLLYVVVVLVLYHLFRDSGPAVRLAAVMGVVGLLFVIVNDFLALASVELAARTAVADSATKPALEAVDGTLLVLRSQLEIVGNALAWGVGGGLFSLAIVRTERVSRWLGWTGLLFAALMVVSLFEVMFTPGGIRESMVFFVGNFYGRFWLVALGVALVRVDGASVP